MFCLFNDQDILITLEMYTKYSDEIVTLDIKTRFISIDQSEMLHKIFMFTEWMVPTFHRGKTLRRRGYDS